MLPKPERLPVNFMLACDLARTLPPPRLRSKHATRKPSMLCFRSIWHGTARGCAPQPYDTPNVTCFTICRRRIACLRPDRPPCYQHSTAAHVIKPGAGQPHAVLIECVSQLGLARGACRFQCRTGDQ